MARPQLRIFFFDGATGKKMKREAGGIGVNVVRQDSRVALNNQQWQTVDRKDPRVALDDPQWQSLLV
jgi:hypothetical protein